MKKFIVEASVGAGMYRPVYFSCRNTALRFIKNEAAWLGGEWYLNGKLVCHIKGGSFYDTL